MLFYLTLTIRLYKTDVLQYNKYREVIKLENKSINDTFIETMKELIEKSYLKDIENGISEQEIIEKIRKLDSKE